jgi:ribulose-bisphosphate carboxylase small chain
MTERPADGGVRRLGLFSYLPPLTDAEVELQVRAILGQDLIAGVEHARDPGPRDSYWSLWKLPLFDARAVGEVTAEIAACAAAHPASFVRLVGYDPGRQRQVVSLIVRRPASA